MDLGQEAETLEEGKGRPSVISLRDACKQQVLANCSVRVGWMEKEAGGGSSSSVNGMTSSPSSGRLNATENTHHLGGGWTTRGLRVFRLGKMKDASGNSSLGGRRRSAACLGVCPEQPTLLFLSRAAGDKLGKVRGRLLRGAFPEPSSGSPDSWRDLPPTLHPGTRAISCCPVLKGLFPVGHDSVCFCLLQARDRGSV